MYCNKCGSLLKKEDKFCGKCGSTIKEEKFHFVKEKKEVKEEQIKPLIPNKYILLATIVFFIVSLALVGIVSLFMNNNILV